MSNDKPSTQGAVTIVEISGVTRMDTDTKKLALELASNPNIQYILSKESESSAQIVKSLIKMRNVTKERQEQQYTSFLIDQVTLHADALDSTPRLYAAISALHFEDIAGRIEQIGFQVNEIPRKS